MSHQLDKNSSSEIKPCALTASIKRFQTCGNRCGMFLLQSLQIEESDWRVIATYLEKHDEALLNDISLAYSKKQRPGIKFDEKQHKSLNGELKYLYTAITRAKCHLWIYDMSNKKRLPVFDYWNMRGLVKVVGTESNLGETADHSIVFASISTPEQWKVQGDNLMKRKLWEQARHCYLQAGDENAYLAKEAEARMLVRQAEAIAGTAKAGLYMKAALCFLKCDDLHHNVKYLTLGAVCLMQTRQPYHIVRAAKLFEALEKVSVHQLMITNRARTAQPAGFVVNFKFSRQSICVYVPRILAICAISKLRCAICESLQLQSCTLHTRASPPLNQVGSWVVLQCYRAKDWILVMTSRSLPKVYLAHLRQRWYHNNHGTTQSNRITGYSGNSHCNLIQSRHLSDSFPDS